MLFIDEDQSVTPQDYATVDAAKQLADRTGSSFQLYELTEQHRSGGSNAYEAWVDALLEGDPVVWRDEEHYQVTLADSPEQLETLTFDPHAPGARSGARLLAGFCWTWQPWPQAPDSMDDVPYDIDIGGWKKRWNLRKSIDGYPKDSSWASDLNGAAQVGSVFTAQGFEFGRCGVIMVRTSDGIRKPNTGLSTSPRRSTRSCCEPPETPLRWPIWFVTTTGCFQPGR
ncbi:MAG: DUF2075 domain-containing protein [Actinomycetota bacterium]|nr:DUF2075 domain-containing protein [Actinomycetota bacterium]